MWSGGTWSGRNHASKGWYACPANVHPMRWWHTGMCATFVLSPSRDRDPEAASPVPSPLTLAHVRVHHPLPVTYGARFPLPFPLNGGVPLSWRDQNRPCSLTCPVLEPTLVFVREQQPCHACTSTREVPGVGGGPCLCRCRKGGGECMRSLSCGGCSQGSRGIRSRSFGGGMRSCGGPTTMRWLGCGGDCCTCAGVHRGRCLSRGCTSEQRHSTRVVSRSVALVRERDWVIMGRCEGPLMGRCKRTFMRRWTGLFPSLILCRKGHPRCILWLHDG